MGYTHLKPFLSTLFLSKRLLKSKLCHLDKNVCREAMPGGMTFLGQAPTPTHKTKLQPSGNLQAPPTVTAVAKDAFMWLTGYPDQKVSLLILKTLSYVIHSPNL